MPTAFSDPSGESYSIPHMSMDAFGETALKDTNLDVRFHTKCGGDHTLKYEGWKWVLMQVGVRIRVASQTNYNPIFCYCWPLHLHILPSGTWRQVLA